MLIYIFGKTFNIEVSRDQYKGLGGRAYIPPGTGMMFHFPDPHNTEIWMKGMLVPLDIIFLDRHMQITAIYRNIQPGNTRIFTAKIPSFYVIELPGGSI